MPDHDTPVTDHDDVQLPYMPPAEIDAKLNALGRERALLVSRRESLRVAARRAREGRHPNIPAAQRWEGEAATCETKVDALTARMAPYEQEYRRRGGWPRAFLVQNVGGHVHRSTSCTSCYPSTRYEWLTHYSGCSEDEIVYAAGELACTVCYPTAPVQVLTRVGEIRRRTDVEREQRAAQKAAKASAASAAAVTDPATGMTLYRTERAASNAIASALNSLLWYGDEHPSARPSIAPRPTRSSAPKREKRCGRTWHTATSSSRISCPACRHGSKPTASQPDWHTSRNRVATRQGRFNDVLARRLPPHRPDAPRSSFSHPGTRRLRVHRVAHPGAGTAWPAKTPRAPTSERRNLGSAASARGLPVTRSPTRR